MVNFTLLTSFSAFVSSLSITSLGVVANDIIFDLRGVLSEKLMVLNFTISAAPPGL